MVSLLVFVRVCDIRACFYFAFPLNLYTQLYTCIKYNLTITYKINLKYLSFLCFKVPTVLVGAGFGGSVLLFTVVGCVIKFMTNKAKKNEVVSVFCPQVSIVLACKHASIMLCNSKRTNNEVKLIVSSAGFRTNEALC